MDYERLLQCTVNCRYATFKIYCMKIRSLFGHKIMTSSTHISILSKGNLSNWWNLVSFSWSSKNYKKKNPKMPGLCSNSKCGVIYNNNPQVRESVHQEWGHSLAATAAYVYFVNQCLNTATAHVLHAVPIVLRHMPFKVYLPFMFWVFQGGQL